MFLEAAPSSKVLGCAFLRSACCGIQLGPTEGPVALAHGLCWEGFVSLLWLHLTRYLSTEGVQGYWLQHQISSGLGTVASYRLAVWQSIQWGTRLRANAPPCLLGFIRIKRGKKKEKKPQTTSVKIEICLWKTARCVFKGK